MHLRDLPSVDRLLGDDVLAAAPRPLAAAAARSALERARATIRAGEEPGNLVALARAELQRLGTPALRRVLNAAGVIVHTNLGRAPLAEAALTRALDVGGSYSNLELDLESGTRGSRQDHVADALCRLTSAEAALVVNNNAAAVLLGLADGRGRDDEPHPRGRLRARDRPRDRAPPPCAPVELPDRRLHGEPDDGG